MCSVLYVYVKLTIIQNKESTEKNSYFLILFLFCMYYFSSSFSACWVNFTPSLFHVLVTSMALVDRCHFCCQIQVLKQDTRLYVLRWPKYFTWRLYTRRCSPAISSQFLLFSQLEVFSLGIFWQFYPYAVGLHFFKFWLLTQCVWNSIMPQQSNLLFRIYSNMHRTQRHIFIGLNSVPV